jgi:hypothetical protein
VDALETAGGDRGRASGTFAAPSCARELIETIAPSSSVGGAPRSMNMGNIASPRRYDEGLCASTDAPRLRHPVGEQSPHDLGIGARAANNNARAWVSVVLPCCSQSEGLNSLFAHDLATTSSWNRRMASTVSTAKLKSIAFTPSSRMARRSSMISALLPENRNRSPLSAYRMPLCRLKTARRSLSGTLCPP